MFPIRNITHARKTQIIYKGTWLPSCAFLSADETFLVRVFCVGDGKSQNKRIISRTWRSPWVFIALPYLGSEFVSRPQINIIRTETDTEPNQRNIFFLVMQCQVF